MASSVTDAKRLSQGKSSPLSAAKCLMECGCDHHGEIDLQAVHSTRSVAAIIQSSLDASRDAQPKVHNEVGLLLMLLLFVIYFISSSATYDSAQFQRQGG